MEGAAEKIKEIISAIAGFMDLDCQIDVKREEENSRANLMALVYTPENAKFLIGKNGQNLKALEHIIKVVVLKNNRDVNNISLDVNDYKKSRASHVIELAKEVVGRVRNLQKAEALTPMSSYERKIIHMELASYPDVTTESVGEGPQRRIIIKPYP